MRQISRILCPVDLSEASRHAVAHAIVLAKWYQARITALQVCNPVLTPTTDFVVAGAVPRIALTEEEIQGVRDDVTALFGDTDVDVLVQPGQPAQQILECAEAESADLIVIGTHGSSGFEHLVLGSVTEKVLRQSSCPVMTVPPLARASSKLPFQRLVCPVDFSDSSLVSLDFAFSLAREADAELTVVHVFEWPDEPLTTRAIVTPEFRHALERDALLKLENLVPAAARDWCRPATRLAHGKAYREILGIATEENADLIVMGVHGRHPVDLMLFGSTTNQVVRRATCPVLTLRR